MPEPQKIWTGTWMGIAAHVEMIGGAPVPFLSGRRAQFETDVLGILAAAVVGLAEERDAAQVKPMLLDNAEHDRLSALLGETATRLFDAERERDALRDRLAKLEAALGSLVSEEGEDLAEVLMEDRADRNDLGWLEAISEHRQRIERARAVLKGLDDGEASKN